MSVWSERGLPVITLGLDRGEYIADAETARGHDYRVLSGLTEMLAQAERSLSRITARDLRILLKNSFDEQRGESFTRFLQAPATAAIWLDFRAPAGILPALPWDTAFQQVLDIPIFRLPRHEILPLADVRSLSASIYVDNPSSNLIANQIEGLLSAVTSCADENEINIFGDQQLFKNLSSSRNRRSSKRDPGNRQAVITHPLNGLVSWADLVQSAHPAASVDLLIVIAPAIVIDQRPSMMMSFGVAGRRIPVSPEEIAQCATELGAWSIGVVGTGEDGENSGRMLSHELAAARPGPVVSAPSPRDVGLMYRRLLAREPGRVYLRDWTTGAASAYVHPDGPDALAPGIEPSAYDPDRRRKLQEVLDSATLGAATAAAAIPRWLASNQRVLEQFAEPLLHARLPDDIANERRVGYATGMERVSSIIRNAYRLGAGDV